MKHHVLDTLVGNTGDATKLTMVMASSFAGRRGEFVRISHQEHEDEPPSDVLGRIVSINRVNALYDAGMGSGVTELELMPGARVTGESIMNWLRVFGNTEAVRIGQGVWQQLHTRAVRQKNGGTPWQRMGRECA